MKKNVQTAVLFDAFYIEGIDDYQFLVPKRILLGETDEKRLKFYDQLSQKVYFNSDYAMVNEIQESFYFVEDLEVLQKKYETEDFSELVQKYLDDIRKKVYYFDDFESQILTMDDINNFFEKSGIKITYGFIKDDQHKFDDVVEQNSIVAEFDRKTPNIKEAYNEITKHILCQDEQVKKLLTAIYKNLYFENEEMKSNILIYGPTGVGKSAMLKKIAKVLDLPIVIEDSTRFTVSGYKGSDIEDALVNLYYAADEDLESAQHGILVFDEIDKKAATQDVSEVTTEGAINGMLKIVEGSVINIEVSPQFTVPFDTSRLTVIFSGAFSKMQEKLNNKPAQIGFGAPLKTSGGGYLATKYTPEDFVKYGFSPEFIGRINCYISLNPLTLEDIKHILKNSESSPLKAYENTFKELKLSLSMQNRLIDLIAEKAFRMNTGARGLKVIVNEMFENILFEILANDIDYDKLVLCDEILEDNSKGYQFTKNNKKNSKVVLK